MRSVASAPHSLPKELRKLQGTTIAGSYRIDGVLGSGNMGVVFRGLQLKLKRPIAVKVIDPQIAGSERATARFQREAEGVARLDHPNCLQVYDYGTTEDNLHYMVMPLLDGQPLHKLLSAGSLSPLRALVILEQVLAGLAHAHAQGLIHRDLKPSNILITRTEDGKGEIVKLVDFGIAKIVDDEASFQTRTGMLFGTPAYMSPEQAVGEPLDARSDIYSAGLLLYRLIVGDVPHRGRSVVEQLRKRATLDVPDLPAPCPPEISALVRWMCARELADRCPDASSARERVKALLDGAPKDDPAWSRPVEMQVRRADVGATIGDDFTGAAMLRSDSSLGIDEVLPESETAITESLGIGGSPEGDTRLLERTDVPGSQPPGDPDPGALNETSVLEPERSEPEPAAEPVTAEPVAAPPTAEEDEPGRPAWVVPLIFITAGVLAIFAFWRLTQRPAPTAEDDGSAEVVASGTTGVAEGGETGETTDAEAITTGRVPAGDETTGAAPDGDTGGAPPETEGTLEKLKKVNVTDPSKALPFAERHELLDELRADEDAAELIDETGNALLDLAQASDAEEPCPTFLAALEVLAEEEDAEIKRALKKAHAPEGDDPACARARKRLKKLQGGKSGSKPGPKAGGDDGKGADDSGEPKPGDITPKLGGLD